MSTGLKKLRTFWNWERVPTRKRGCFRPEFSAEVRRLAEIGPGKSRRCCCSSKSFSGPSSKCFGKAEDKRSTDATGAYFSIERIVRRMKDLKLSQQQQRWRFWPFSKTLLLQQQHRHRVTKKRAHTRAHSDARVSPISSGPGVPTCFSLRRRRRRRRRRPSQRRCSWSQRLTRMQPGRTDTQGALGEAAHHR